MPNRQKIAQAIVVFSYIWFFVLYCIDEKSNSFLKNLFVPFIIACIAWVLPLLGVGLIKLIFVLVRQKIETPDLYKLFFIFWIVLILFLTLGAFMSIFQN